MSTDDTYPISSIRLTARVDQTAPRPPGDKGELALLAPGHVLQWKDVPAEQRPFKTPGEEFAYSNFTFAEDRLRYRWDGLGFDAEITRIYAMPDPERWRQQMQAVQTIGENAPDITNPQFQKNLASVSVLQLNSMLQQEQWLYDTRQEPTTITELDEKTGQLTRKIVYRPATARESNTRFQTISRIKQEMRLDMGQATVIVKDETDRANQTPAVNFLQIINDPEASRRAAILAQQLTRPALDTPALPESVTEGEVVETAKVDAA